MTKFVVGGISKTQMFRGNPLKVLYGFLKSSDPTDSSNDFAFQQLAERIIDNNQEYLVNALEEVVCPRQKVQIWRGMRTKKKK